MPRAGPVSNRIPLLSSSTPMKCKFPLTLSFPNIAVRVDHVRMCTRS